MKIKKWWPVMLLLGACSTITPSIFTTVADVDIMQYFLPATEWVDADSKAKAFPDITYRTNTDTPAAVNISFYGKKDVPRRITYISLNGNGVDYPLENIKILYIDSDKRILRVTTQGNRDTLASLLETSSITLTAEIDGVKYTYIPHKDFIKLKDDFLTMISY
ncbi:MAG: hypothetical protein LBU85_02120 [Treponema sp.]|jgi:hypothetical protein|nr:hypothetical protein [Treponema sp.]